MPQPKLTDAELRRRVTVMRKDGNQIAAAAHLGISRGALQKSLAEAVARGITKPGACRSRAHTATRASAEAAAARDATLAASEPPAPADPVDLRRLKDLATDLRAENVKLVDRARRAEDLRGAILGLGAPKLTRVDLGTAVPSKGARSAILHLSDLHYGETVVLDQVDGINSYSVAIADRRLARIFDTACRLLTVYWKGPPPERLHLCLGGDMVSGALHPELARTDELTRLPSAQAVAHRLAEGVREIRKRVGCPVTIYSVPGNHGRLTPKPETKAHVADNLDTLVAWFLEAAVASDDKIEVRYSGSVDCLFSVYGRHFLVTHGDRMGSRGGQGFLGPVATILRGHFKLHADYADRGVHLYRILTAHFHTTCRLPLGYGNGSLVGLSDLARDLRARKEPASQNLFIVHSEKGIIDFQELRPGAPAEGSIYGAAA